MTDTKLRTREVQQMDRKLVFARMYFDSTMENVSAGEARASEMEVEKGFSDYLELMTYMATLNGELVPDFEKASEAISAIEQAKKIAEDNSWNIVVLRETAGFHIQIIPDSLIDIKDLEPLFKSASRVSVDHCEGGMARFHFRYPTHRYTGHTSFPW